MELPGRRAVTTVHVGPYDSMHKTYAEVHAWMATQGLTPADHMWEVYLSDPSAEPDSSTWRTQIVWPVDG
jgi:effector-binding domain-containing protein